MATARCLLRRVGRPRVRPDLADNGTATIPTPAQSPRSNAFAERWIRTVRAECTDRLLVTGERQLHAVLNQYAEHYNTGKGPPQPRPTSTR
ncbi:integrase core domain-containing protein [Streptomyces cucumeris]|uniref:integrase core domain-containing protein n=1 Tax=Streptomyces cucumeris TaxID=2962890 RepID=UPI003D74DB22